MAQRKDYGLVGVGTNIEMSKGGGQWLWNTDHFEATSDGATLAQIRVPTTPVNDNDAASKIYVDSMTIGLDFKESVRAATVANIAALTGLLTVDGVTLVAGDRILVKDQTTASENGIYLAAAGAWTRSVDADTPNLTANAFTFVSEGTTNADTGWVLTTNDPITVGVTNLTWTQFSSAGVITAGIGLTQTGFVFDVNVGATTIAVNGGDDLIVDSSATANQVLLSAGTVGTEATYGALPLDDTNAVTNLLGKANGGTNTDTSAFADESLLVADNTNGDYNELPIGTNGNVLVVSGGAVTWGQVDLADDTNAVTGLLDKNNGGTNTDTSAFADESLVVWDNTNGDVNEVAIGADGNVLTVVAGAVAWQAPTMTGGIFTIEADITFNGGATQAIGDIPAGGRVIKVSIDVGTAWDATETVEIGDAGLTDRLMTAVENNPEEIMLFSGDLNNLYAALTTVNATVTNANTPAAGAARVIVQYIAP